MANVLQLTNGTVQVLRNASSYNPDATGAFIAASNLAANSVALIAANANTAQVFAAQPEAFHIRPLMQWRINTWYWLTQYETTPQQVTQYGYNLRLFLADDRKVPGGGTDPGSGKIVQLEVPTTAGQPNPMVAVLPFPVGTVAP